MARCRRIDRSAAGVALRARQEEAAAAAGAAAWHSPRSDDDDDDDETTTTTTTIKDSLETCEHTKTRDVTVYAQSRGSSSRGAREG